MSDRQTVAGAFAKIEAHEDLCAERYGNIHSTLSDLRAAADKQSTLLWGIVIGVGAFAVATLLAIVLHALKLA